VQGDDALLGSLELAGELTDLLFVTASSGRGSAVSWWTARRHSPRQSYGPTPSRRTRQLDPSLRGKAL